MRRKRMSGIGFFARGLSLSALVAGVFVVAHYATAPPAPDWSPQHDERLQIASSEHPLAPGARAWASLQAQRASFSDIAAGPTIVPATTRSMLPIDRAWVSNGEAATRLTHSIQVELQRVGCYQGRPHGFWDEPTQAAMATFVRGIGSPMPVTGPQFAMLTLLQGGTHSGASSPCMIRGTSPMHAASVTRPSVEPTTTSSTQSIVTHDIEVATDRSEAKSPRSLTVSQPLIIIAPPPSVSAVSGQPGLSRVASPSPSTAPISTAELKRGELHLDRATAGPSSFSAHALQAPRMAQPALAGQTSRQSNPARIAAKGESAELAKMWLELRRGAP